MRPMFPLPAQIEVQENGCWNWLAYKNPAGYGQVRVNWVLWLAHRYSWHCNKGDIPEYLLVLHHCDNPACVNPDHLFLGTHADNLADRDAKGKHNRGERNGQAKVTAEQVELIRKRYEAGETQSQLGRAFGMNRSAIHKIVHKTHWK